jgi:hypothetical protein
MKREVNEVCSPWRPIPHRYAQQLLMKREVNEVCSGPLRTTEDH